MASAAFELVQMDLCGPCKISYLTRANYLLTMVDNHTRYTWLYLLQNKMQAPTYIHNFIAYVQNDFHRKIKHIKSDNGVFQDFSSDLFKKNEIEHQKSVPKTPQQNGRVKIKHRHLVETASATSI